MAAPLSTALDVHRTIDSQRIIFFTKPHRQRNYTAKRFTISCTKSPTKSKSPEDLSSKNPSLSEQLESLSSTTLSTAGKGQSQALNKPKSIWINPAKPRRSVIDLQRQRLSHYQSYNPDIKQLLVISANLNSCAASEDAFKAILEEIPQPISRDNALLVLNNLRSWQKTLAFFNWLKTQEGLPMETIFYNVTMKSLRYGRQFGLIDKLANEMVSNGVQLDNITYSTIISSAKKCNCFDKAMEWFERMYQTGLMPDEVTYSAILDVYAKLGKVEEVISLYERGRSSGWKPDCVAFSVLGKMFGEAGDYDGVRYVLQEMRSVAVKPNVVVYNTLLEATGKAAKPGLARSLFEEMLESGIAPNERTLSILVKIYGRVRWSRDALELWERIKENKWPMDFILYNTLLSMCADVGLEEEAEKLFEEMKESKKCRPDSYSYTSMLKLYGSGGNADKAMELFNQMCKMGAVINVMGCTCLIQCLGKAGRIEDLVRVFDISVKKGVKPDDRLCGCLLSVVSLCEKVEDADNVISCLQQANPKLVAFVKLMEDEKISLAALREEFKGIISNTAVDCRRPFCNCFIDICRKRNLHDRAHDLLYLGTVFGLYPGLHKKTADEWCLDVRSLSIGAALTALEEWMMTLSKLVEREERLPELFLANAGSGTHRYSLGLASSLASHVKELAAPFKPSEEKTGCLVATRDDIVSWVQSRIPSAVAA